MCSKLLSFLVSVLLCRNVSLYFWATVSALVCLVCSRTVVRNYDDDDDDVYCMQLTQYLSHDLIREGWLYKTGPRPGSSYKKRWMSLHQRQLFYFARPLVIKCHSAVQRLTVYNLHENACSCRWKSTPPPP